MQDQSLDWGKCVWLCTDQAASITGFHSGAIAKIKKLQTKICCLHIACITVNLQLFRNCHLNYDPTS